MQIFSILEAAGKIGIDPSLVRRMCRMHKIGTKLNERAWVLTMDDIERLRAARGSRGNPNFVPGHTPPPRKSRKKSTAKSRKK